MNARRFASLFTVATAALLLPAIPAHAAPRDAAHTVLALDRVTASKALDNGQEENFPEWHRYSVKAEG